MDQKFDYIFDDVEYCEEIGTFENEYVYDVEVDDDTHTFIANDILIHNSVFVSFKPAIDNCKWQNLVFNDNYLNQISEKFIILSTSPVPTKNPNLVGQTQIVTDLESLLSNDHDILLIDGHFVKDRRLNKLINENLS